MSYSICVFVPSVSAGTKLFLTLMGSKTFMCRSISVVTTVFYSGLYPLATHSSSINSDNLCSPCKYRKGICNYRMLNAGQGATDF